MRVIFITGVMVTFGLSARNERRVGDKRRVVERAYKCALRSGRGTKVKAQAPVKLVVEHRVLKTRGGALFC